MMTENNITIDLSKRCRRCGAKGAAPNGLCLGCISALVRAGQFDHVIGHLKTEKPKRKGSR